MTTATEHRHQHHSREPMTNNTMQDDRSTATRAGKDHRTRTRAPDG